MTAGPEANVREYRDFWGLRLTKQTVNFDDPGTYHLYYGDYKALPGTALTYFPWPHLAQRKPGNHEASAVAYHVSPDALDAWEVRLREAGRPVMREDRFGQPVLISQDNDGFTVELVGAVSPDSPVATWPQSSIAEAEQLRGFHSITLRVPRPSATATVLTSLLGFEAGPTEGARQRFFAKGHTYGQYVDLLEDRTSAPARPGRGSIHHVAFRVPDIETHQQVSEQVRRAGLPLNGPIDRSYFTAGYFREPNGILFELSTDGPGFTLDEPVESLGSSLKLPPQYEAHRSEIVRVLPPIPALKS